MASILKDRGSRYRLSERKSDNNKIGIMGLWGIGNLGNSATMEALILNLRRRCPTADISGFSPIPDDLEMTYGIPSYPLLNPYKHPFQRARRQDISDTTPGETPSGETGIRDLIRGIPFLFPFLKWLKKAILLIAAGLGEARFLVESYCHIKEFDLLLVAGGGQLTDYWGGPWVSPYALYRWALLARVAKVKYAFVSVGAGPLDSKLGRFFARRSLSLADYRSFRDKKSRDLAESIGVAGISHVFPDLAYSLPHVSEPRHSTISEKRLAVGISPITYMKAGVWARTDNSTYQTYISKLAEMVVWLVDRNYKIVFFQSQARMDTVAIQDVRDALANMGHGDLEGSTTAPRITTVEELSSAILGMDLVVASRFHSVLISSLLFKPVVALSFDVKVDSLMESLCLSQYVLDIAKFSLEQLSERFSNLEASREAIGFDLTEKVKQFQHALEDQYSMILDGCLVRPPCSSISERSA
jgi:polysaccharide pyruvyl transferase WcaK-like protein